MSADEQRQLLGDLESLLEKQIGLAQQGDIGKIEVLSKQADALVEKISQTGILNSTKLVNQRGKLRKLYSDLCLSVTAQKADTAEELSRIRKGRKTIETYRSNI